ncbi:YitT family protein [Periweissella fabalis]|uniref:YitT family protein n=1 Tax=Periweissella fabalis TaxID=1070421 RepID=A0A7X6N3K2_9LACO|nr:YitT family protein [Periweissella fabalis]MCM0598948.1 YitT family protein [Periweissella fabalis]NKZ23228.1 YitT family protein [Periweissella fabalis]
MRDIQNYFDRHLYIGRIGTAFIYAVMVSVALNYFWTPGHIYSSGITGLAQLFDSLSQGLFGFNIPVYIFLFVFNVPLIVAAWRSIGRRFAIFTTIAVVLASIMIRVIDKPVTLTHDPLIDAIFGGLVNGFATGLALRNGISTGGLDIIGILIRKRTGMRMGLVNMTFNAFIMVAAGVVFGWQFAFYSAIGVFVNARVIDTVYTRQQKMQIMIITDRPKTVVDSIQNHLRRGITIIHGAEGAYKHDNKDVLFTVISQYEQYEVTEALAESDAHAFMSMWRVDKIQGNFYEPKL